MVADLGRIMNGDAMPFPLADGDIVYVPRGGVGDWNQTLKDLLPTLQTVSSILQPFVQIKFLTDDD
jgi:polysaccharide export outer membrane protein